MAMRRLETKEETERKRVRNVRLMSGFMLVVLLFSVAGFSFLHSGGSTGAENYGGEASQGSSRPSVSYNGQQIFLSVSSNQVGDVSIEGIFGIRDYAGQPVYIDYGGDATALNEIASAVRTVAERVQPACYGECEDDLPERTCAENLIVFTPGLDNRVYKEARCVFIEGDIRAVDAFIYRLFGVV